MTASALAENPFFAPFRTPYDAPPFDRIGAEHFRPAYDRALAEHAAEIQRIADNPAPPTFANTIVALENSGRLLSRVDAVFSNLASAHTSAALQEIERELAPRLAQHFSAIHLNEALFHRIDVLASSDELTTGPTALDAESQRVLARYHLDFVRAGAKLPAGHRQRLADIVAELATLGTQFGQNVLADEQAFVLPLAAEDLAGVPEFVRQAAARSAKDRGLHAPFAVTTARSSVEPILQFAHSRSLREKIFKAWIARGDNDNAHNNGALIGRIVQLRTERAALLGYPSFAHYKLADTMAKTPQAARQLLTQVWEPARRRADEERAALQQVIVSEGGDFSLQPWDWRYYAEKLRKARYDLDEAELMPYFSLDQMIAAAQYTAQRLFGLTFCERSDLPVYHPDVRVWEVSRGGEHLGLFYGDYFARPEKRSGAWMSSFRDQENLGTPVTPLIINNCNFARGTPTLLSFDEAKTLFHEFGHALHGLLSQVRYPRLSGTNVARDFVELPSQLYEHWLEEPAILERFARHHATAAPIPAALLEKLRAARHFNQGFATVEFLASALVDLDYHTRADAGELPAPAFQAAALQRIGMPQEIVMRHASPHFLHVFAGDGYAAGYYSYLWAEVLDADGFAAFTETGDAFHSDTAQRLHDYVYSAGGTRDFAEAYRRFRGREPQIDALLLGRGLLS